MWLIIWDERAHLKQLRLAVVHMYEHAQSKVQSIVIMFQIFNTALFSGKPMTGARTYTGPEPQ